MREVEMTEKYGTPTAISSTRTIYAHDDDQLPAGQVGGQGAVPPEGELDAQLPRVAGFAQHQCRHRAVVQLPDDALIVVLHILAHTVDERNGLLRFAGLQQAGDDMQLIQKLVGVGAPRR